MIKIFHTADVHFGVKFLYFGKKAEEQRRQLKKTFEKIVDLAIQEKANLFLIAGDFFDSNHPAKETVDFVRSQLKKLNEAKIYTVILPGTHDRLSEDSIYFKENFSKNLDYIFVFDDPQLTFKKYPDLDLTLWAKANVENKSFQSPLVKINEAKSKYNVAMAHGSVQIEGKAASDDYPITFEEIKNSEMNYIALGHWHGTQDFSQGEIKCWYSGSPELTYREGKGGLGSGYFLEVNLGGDKTEVKPRKVGEREFNEIEIEVTDLTDILDLKEKILKGASQNLIRRVNLIGLADPQILIEPEILEAELGEKFFHLQIINNTHLKIGQIEEKNYPPELVIGQFVNLVHQRIDQAKNDEEKILLEQVLELGLAELEGKEVI